MTVAMATPPSARGYRSRMADVARLAGVSTSTVSRALRQPEIVSAKLRDRINGAIGQLGYVPNLVAGGLAAARSRSVGVVVPSIMNSFFASTIEDMSAVLAARGYQLMLGISDYREQIEDAIVSSLLAWSPAGIVLTGCRHSRQTLRRLLEVDVPIVEMWELDDRPIDCVVGFSARAVGRTVARHFIERGARRPAFVGAALDRDYRAATRGAGFAEAIEAAGLPPPPCIALPERASVTLGAQGLAKLLEQHPDADAAFFSNDALAMGAVFEAQRRGLAIPDRLRICGFGDLDFAAVSVPMLTTVRPPRAEIGRRVAELLIGRFNGTTQSGKVIDLGFELIPRESS